MSREPTDRQRTLVRAIFVYIRRYGFPPSRRELAEILGMKSTNGVSDMLRAAQKKQLLVVTAKSARAIVITPVGLALIGEAV